MEVRTADPGFSVEEAAALLGAGMGLRLEREQVAALVEPLTRPQPHPGGGPRPRALRLLD